ncbi:hypothetical protein CNMCM5793_008535 [Aspergillus hiratsukae]|uniref:Purine nucleoside permease n=1 Tax=Aspergillus hiratsukae TaxID=1194566 RepID=A0A8H6V0E7_9EURO|nr:hypothetical protein CNMCM5793_008535 [Aspergillus hiratsukae]KAF7169385.1 hypothetical protein CNMCM6106_004310 [Aspergillus hiratsukae]
MHLVKSIATGLLLAGCSLGSAVPKPAPVAQFGKEHQHPSHKIAPKVFIISMFAPEAEAWWNIPEFDLLAHNITLPGTSPVYPDVYCTADYSICQLITGESEINAAVTVSSVAFSPLFDLTHTYFMIAGIAGVNPKVATIGGVAFARYAVQVALHFEVNAELRSLAASFARTAQLADSATAKAYRAMYATDNGTYTAGTQAPSVVECDVSTSDVYFSGTILDDVFDNTVKVLTNGTGVYCTTAQEDNATLEALLRAASHKLVDFSRIIVMRTASDFDRPYPGQSAIDNLLYADQGAFEPAVQNIYSAGIKVVEGILDGWDKTFAAGVKPSNYIGDEFGTLGGTPDFGPGRTIAREEANALKKRGVAKRRRL